jgi:gag-polyprotein putative aspartyl protease
VNRTTRFLSAILMVASIGGRAASVQAAPSQHGRDSTVKSSTSDPIPHAVSFREVPGRGLLVRTWVNGIGPFNFAIDTGAGATLLSSRVAAESRVRRASDKPASIAGLTGTKSIAYHASVESLAIGDIENYLPAKGEVMITSGLPPDLDGVLDPTEALAPLGYTIDIPGREFMAFDPRSEAVQMNQAPPEGTVVNWLREAHGRRPFVMLDNGDRALIDTGSSLGLAVRDPNSGSRSSGSGARDLGGGQISTRRVSTSTVSIGSLTLKRIPTDLVSGTEADAPVLLGLTALRPFRLRFDPLHRLIEIAPIEVSRRD